MPNVVKGSKQEKMIVVPHRPLLRAAFTTAAILTVVMSIVAGYGFGYFRTLQSAQSVRQSEDELTVLLASASDENTNLRRQVAILESSSVMDQRANEEVQQTISSLREKVLRLEQDIVFYRQVISDEIDSSGIIIGQLDIESTDQPNIFNYKLVLRQQESSEDSFLIGYVNVNLVGNINDEQIVVPLRDLSEEQSDIDIRLRYRYFQNVEGRIVLPSGFMPDQIHVTASATSPVEASVSKNFSWVVERG